MSREFKIIIGILFLVFVVFITWLGSLNQPPKDPTISYPQVAMFSSSCDLYHMSNDFTAQEIIDYRPIKQDYEKRQKDCREKQKMHFEIEKQWKAEWCARQENLTYAEFTDCKVNESSEFYE